mmetsp:Transcript_42069/g.116185  ORF Transcript_42069/g.116185 Transcript_42069/m.116185 type:complete len:580 (+) Transcript_42069:73-1812(+)
MGGRGKAASGKGYPTSCSDDDGASDSESDAVEVDDGHVFFGHEAERAAAVLGLEDDDDCGEVLSPFGEKRFPMAAACWAHAAQAHGFSLEGLRRQVGQEAWTDYHRIRLVNFLRALGPERARDEAPRLTGTSEIWQDERWLQPVMENDALLFDDDDDMEDAGTRMDNEAGIGAAGSAPGTAPGVVGESGSAGLEAENARLRAELASARRMLAAYAGDEDEALSPKTGRGAACAQGVDRSDSGGPAGGRHPALQPHAVEAFQRIVLSTPDLLKGKRALTVGGGGVLSCLCAQHGVDRVVALEASAAALANARSALAASGLAEKVDVVALTADGEPEESFGPCDVLVAERFLAESRYGPWLPRLLRLRQRHLQPSGAVVPGQLRLQVRAADFSADVAEYRAWLQASGLGGLVGAGCSLAPAAAARTPTCEALPVVDEDRVASAGAATLFSLDLATAVPEAALPSAAPFRLSLRPDRRATALVLSLEARLPGEAVDDAGTSLPRWARAQQEANHLVLHMPALETLQPSGAESNVLEGRFTANWTADSECLEVTVQLSAQRYTGGRGGKGPDPCCSATFLPPA